MFDNLYTKQSLHHTEQIKMILDSIKPTYSSPTPRYVYFDYDNGNNEI